MSIDETLKKQIEEEVIKLTSEELGGKTGEITRNSRFVEDLGADSLDTIELIMKLEERYNLKIEDKDAQQMLTVGSAIDYIKSHYRP